MELLGATWFIFLIFGVLLILLIPFIFYLITLQNTLKEVKYENRKMEPGLVWLMFIPLFNLVWQFIVITRVADSIQAELTERGQQVTERPGYNIGLSYAILSVCSLLPIPFIKSLLSLAALICFIIHWVKIAEYKRLLIHTRDMQRNTDSSIFY